MSWIFNKPSLEKSLDKVIDKIGEYVLLAHRDMRFPCVSCNGARTNGICHVCLGTGYRVSYHASKAWVSFGQEEGAFPTNGGYAAQEMPSIHFPNSIAVLPMDLVFITKWALKATGDPYQVLSLRKCYRVTEVVDRTAGADAWRHAIGKELPLDLTKSARVIQASNIVIHYPNFAWQPH